MLPAFLLFTALCGADLETQAEKQASPPAPLVTDPGDSEVRRLRPGLVPLLTFQHTGGSSDEDTGLGADIDKLSAGLALPLTTHDARAVLLRVGYRFDSLRLGGGDTARLHQIFLGVPLVLRPHPRWTVTGSAGAIYAGDFKKHHLESWQPALRLTANYALSNDAAFVFGVFWGRTGLGLYPFPVLGVIYKPEGSDWELLVLPPRRIEVAYKRLEPVTLYALTGLSGGVWWRTASGGQGGGAYVSVAETELGLGARVDIPGDLSLGVESGALVMFRIRVDAPGVPDVTRRQQPGWYLRLRISRRSQ